MRPLSPASELTYACILPPAGQRPIAQRFIEALRQDLEEKCERERAFADNISVLPTPEHAE